MQGILCPAARTKTMKNENKNHELNSAALRAKTDDAFLNEFILSNKRFILGVAYKVTGRFVTESDDEWSIALIAFHEAIQAYDESKGSFKSFAGLVIKRRLLDNADAQQKFSCEISTDFGGAEPEEDDILPPATLEANKRIAEDSVSATNERTALQDEIAAMQEILGSYGFSFFDLASSSPKAQKTKDACATVIRCILDDQTLLASMKQSKTIPSKELCQKTGVAKKILERHRKYIITASEILSGDFPMLSEYLHFITQGGAV